MSLLILLDFHSWDAERINQILIFAFVLKCPGRGNLPFTCFPRGKPSCFFRLSFQTQGCPQLTFFYKKIANNASRSQSIFTLGMEFQRRAFYACCLKRIWALCERILLKPFYFDVLSPIASCPCDASCVICGFIPTPLYGFFFCMENVTSINRADAMLLACVASTAMGSHSQHVCPAQEGCTQSATTLGPILLAVKLRSNVTAVWDHCAAGAYPVGQCFGDRHCMFSWLNSLLCLVTMPFCLPELREDFLLFLWLKLRHDD